MNDVNGPGGEEGVVDGEAEELRRVHKRDFIRKMAKQADLPLNVTGVAYEAFVATVLSEVRAGAHVRLTGFGYFYRHMHRGHKVRFAKPGEDRIEDYPVLKFSATRESNEFVGFDDDETAGTRVPGTRMLYMPELLDEPSDSETD